MFVQAKFGNRMRIAGLALICAVDCCSPGCNEVHSFCLKNLAHNGKLIFQALVDFRCPVFFYECCAIVE